MTVRLDDESGAAGLAFCSDGGDRHYGFYPSGGRLRLTRFDGADVLAVGHILHNKASEHYAAGEWNTLRVRLEEGKVLCYVNDELAVEIGESALSSGKVGLVKFRDTKAAVQELSRRHAKLPRSTVPPEQARQIAELVEDLPVEGPLDDSLIGTLSVDPAGAATVLSGAGRGTRTTGRAAAKIGAGDARAARDRRPGASTLESGG